MRESVVVETDRIRDISIILPSLPFSQVSSDSAFGYTHGRALSVWRSYNLLAMVRRLSQAEHKHSLSTGRTRSAGSLG